MKTDNLIVGAGLSGIVLACRIVEEKKENVLIIDKRNHIGGYCYDYRNEEGILIHKYGPHIFRTNSKIVWDYMNRFSKFNTYQHKVLAYSDGRLFPMPINLDTVNFMLGTEYSSLDIMEYFETQRKNIDNIESVKDSVTSQIGELFYEKFFKNYTRKQWGEDPDRLPKEIVSRIPIRTTKEDRYFTHKYQGMPVDGYTEMLTRMLDHPKIKVMLNTDYKDIEGQIEYDTLYYSGSVDEFYDYRYGHLPYRCVSFEMEKTNQPQFQPAAVVNYPNDYDFTRITEFKHFYGMDVKNSVIVKEYSSDRGDPSYPIPKVENLNLYKKYVALNDSSRIHFIGRLGEYKYYSMDQVIEKILNIKI